MPDRAESLATIVITTMRVLVKDLSTIGEAECGETGYRQMIDVV